jgi:hypothetical protein
VPIPERFERQRGRGPTGRPALGAQRSFRLERRAQPPKVRKAPPHLPLRSGLAAPRAPLLPGADAHHHAVLGVGAARPRFGHARAAEGHFEAALRWDHRRAVGQARRQQVVALVRVLAKRQLALAQDQFGRARLPARRRPRDAARLVRTRAFGRGRPQNPSLEERHPPQPVPHRKRNEAEAEPSQNGARHQQPFVFRGKVQSRSRRSCDNYCLHMRKLR